MIESVLQIRGPSQCSRLANRLPSKRLFLHQEDIKVVLPEVNDFEDMRIEDKGRGPSTCVLEFSCFIGVGSRSSGHSSKQMTRIDHGFLVVYTVQRKYEPTRSDRKSRRFLYTRAENKLQWKADRNSKLGKGGVVFVMIYRVK